MKKSTKIYLEAARRVAEDEASYSCWAVTNVVNEMGDPGRYPLNFWETPHAQRYMKVFSTNSTFDRLTNKVDSLGSAKKDWRVLALCFMAAVEESGGLE